MLAQSARLSLIGLTALLMLLVPYLPQVAAAPSPCTDVGFTLSYLDERGAVTIHDDDSSAKFPVPINTDLTFTVRVKKAGLAGREVKFSAPNQFLQLSAGSISDGGVASFNQPSTRPSVNFLVRWSRGDTNGDGNLTFRARIHPDTIRPGTERGQLLTIGTQVQGALCGAKMEIFGVPGGGAPDPAPCLGINVAITYSSDNGQTYRPVTVIDQGANKQFAGPKVGNLVKYSVSPVPSPANFILPLHHTVAVNRQTITSASGPLAGTITVSGNGRQVVFSQWDGEGLIVLTQARTVGLDTVTLVSRDPTAGNAVYSLCSTHAELIIGAP